jgi:hypothetical protein
MVTITESKPVNDVVQITQSTRIDWPDRKDLPTSAEFNSLNRLIAARYPAFAAKDAKEFQELWLAFLWTLYACRAEKPNTGAAPSYFAGICDDWLAINSIPGRTSGKAIIAASICHGIAYSAPPYTSLALSLGSSSSPQASAWRKILECGQLPDAIPSPPLNHSIGMSMQRSI